MLLQTELHSDDVVTISIEVKSQTTLFGGSGGSRTHNQLIMNQSAQPVCIHYRVYLFGDPRGIRTPNVLRRRIWNPVQCQVMRVSHDLLCQRRFFV